MSTVERGLSIAAGLVSVALALSVMGCSSTPQTSNARTDTSPRFVTYTNSGSDGFPAGELAGTLEIVGECVTVVSGSDRHLMVWPDGYRLDASTVFDSEGTAIGTSGDEITVGGGEIRSDEAAGEIGAREIHGDVGDCNQTALWFVSP